LLQIAHKTGLHLAFSKTGMGLDAEIRCRQRPRSLSLCADPSHNGSWL